MVSEMIILAMTEDKIDKKFISLFIYSLYSCGRIIF